MISENMNYPLHLGVTEAGDGEDGRVKSAVGIGTLLEDGLGDTVRVSLTEEPEKEAPVAIALVNRYTKRQHDFNTSVIPPILKLTDNNSPTPYISKEVNTFIGGSLVPRVVVDISRQNLKDAGFLSQAGYRYDMLLDKYHMGEQSVDFVYLGDQLPSFNMPANLKQLYNYNTWKSIQNKANIHPLFTLEEFNQANEKDASLNIVKIKNEDLVTSLFETLPLDKTIVFLLETTAVHGMAEQRQFFKNLQEIGLDNPVIIKRTYEAVAFSGPIGDFMNPEEPISKLQLYAATDLGALLIDGFGSGVWIDSPATPLDKIVSLSFGILQATRSRISKTEYISCPSCGRTLFDLQETTQMIRNRTNHLKGLKIGIMGCIVNGPGEMADADYGYVGAGPDKITLYRGQEVVKKNVSSAHALDELINIIKSDGLWIEESEIPN